MRYIYASLDIFSVLPDFVAVTQISCAVFFNVFQETDVRVCDLCT